MKKIKSFFRITAWLVAMMLLALACNDDMDIRVRYLFDLETMPVQKKIIENETAEIRCRLVKEGNYQDTKFYIRMFQPDGVGELRMDDGTVFKPNDLYPLEKETFRLYYTSRSKDQQVIDVYVEDSFGQVVQKTFSFQNEQTEDGEE
ncbi:MAG: conjugal transfer protein [Bacteroidales bacterium 45-6]|nr:MAG: conjugal transfer protein [Bacteroidales bacterium 45-6]